VVVSWCGGVVVVGAPLVDWYYSTTITLVLVPVHAVCTLEQGMVLVAGTYLLYSNLPFELYMCTVVHFSNSPDHYLRLVCPPSADSSIPQWRTSGVRSASGVNMYGMLA
jgi:hypothetical protein